MNQETDYLKDLSEIRSIMERSSRFISLSGLSGICAGVFALAGAWMAHRRIAVELSEIFHNPWPKAYLNGFQLIFDKSNIDLTLYLLLDALIVLVLSVFFGYYFTQQKTKKKGLKMWEATTWRLLINLMIPLVVGGLFVLSLIYHRQFYLIAPATLIFYGLSLINASKYTLTDVRYLGFSEIIVGVIASFSLGMGVIFWAVGFGVLHIVYGALMYFKYEK